MTTSDATPSHESAVAIYEDAMAALQLHAYADALQRFQALAAAFPEERDLVERARLYVGLCDRQLATAAAVPQTIQDRLLAATLAINDGRAADALVHLRLVRDEDPAHDHALYMLAVAHAQRGEAAECLAHLWHAIALNGENRVRARQDADFRELADTPAFLALVEGTPEGRVLPPPETESAR